MIGTLPVGAGRARAPTGRGDDDAVRCGQAPFDQPPAQVADRRHEQEQADNVGDEAGDEQQYAGEQDHHAMRDFAAGVLALGKLLADAGEHAKSLQAHQRAADDAAQDDQRHCRQDADFAADEHETRDLDERQSQDRKQEAHLSDLTRPGLGLSRWGAVPLI